MAFERKTPADIARRLAARSAEAVRPEAGGAWRRETYRMPRGQAREKAREWFELYPKAAYMTEIEFWRVLDNGDVEFTIRRLPSAD